LVAIHNIDSVSQPIRSRSYFLSYYTRSRRCKENMLIRLPNVEALWSID